MRNLTTMLACLAMFNLAGCDDPKNDDTDTGTDTAVDTVVDTVVDTTEDTADPDVPEDTSTDVVEEDGPMVCEDDATHHYITVTGSVNPLPAGDVEGLYIAAISPLDALGSPTPTPLGMAVTDASGEFSMECVNTFGVLLGLVILVDDNPEDGVAGDFFPTGTGVQSWTDPTSAVDVVDATVMGVTNTLVTGIEVMASVDAATDGFVMGLVINSGTGAPVDDATVTRADSTPAPVVYPTAAFDGLETDGTTSANGSFVMEGALGLTSFTAEATGLTFGDHQAATKAGFCYFSMMTSE